MSKTIWKYALKPTMFQEVLMPRGVNIVAIQMQRDEFMMWGIVDPSEEMTEIRYFARILTGEEIPRGAKYITTIQVTDHFVVHWFETFQS